MASNPHADGDTRLFRPRPSEVIKRAPYFLGLFAIVSVLMLLQLAFGPRYGTAGFGSLALPAYGLLVAGPLAWLVVYLARRKRHLRLELNSEALLVYNWRGEHWSMPRSQVRAVEDIDLHLAGNTKPTPWLVVSGPAGSPSYMLIKSDWSLLDLRDIWDELGVAPTRVGHRTYRQVLAEHPHLQLSFRHRHPQLFSFIIAGLLLLYLAIIITPFVLATG